MNQVTMIAARHTIRRIPWPFRAKERSVCVYILVLHHATAMAIHHMLVKCISHTNEIIFTGCHYDTSLVSVLYSEYNEYKIYQLYCTQLNLYLISTAFYRQQNYYQAIVACATSSHFDWQCTSNVNWHIAGLVVVVPHQQSSHARFKLWMHHYFGT